MQLFEWLVVPHGCTSSVAPGWFVRVINEGVEGLSELVVANLDDVIIFITVHPNVSNTRT